MFTTFSAEEITIMSAKIFIVSASDLILDVAKRPLYLIRQISQIDISFIFGRTKLECNQSSAKRTLKTEEPYK